MLLALIASIVLAVTPKHGYERSTYTISFKAPYASSAETGTQYVIGAVNSGTCDRGVSSFGRIRSGPYFPGQTVKFRIHFPKHGLCVGVFHGVAHFERKEGDHWTDKRLGRFGFRVLGG